MMISKLGCDVIRLINDYTVTQLWSNGLKFDIHKKEQEGYLYKSGTDKNIVGHSKLKFNNFFRGHDECECPSYSLSVSRKLKCIDFFLISTNMYYEFHLTLVINDGWVMIRAQKGYMKEIISQPSLTQLDFVNLFSKINIVNLFIATVLINL